MLIGTKLFGLENLRIVGISPEPNAKVEIVSEVERLIEEVGELIEIETEDLLGKIEVFDEYAGEGYCTETEKADEAFNFLSKTKGIILDSIYKAKAFAGLVDWTEKES